MALSSFSSESTSSEVERVGKSWAGLIAGGRDVALPRVFWDERARTITNPAIETATRIRSRSQTWTGVCIELDLILAILF